MFPTHCDALSGHQRHWFVVVLAVQGCPAMSVAIPTFAPVCGTRCGLLNRHTGGHDRRWNLPKKRPITCANWEIFWIHCGRGPQIIARFESYLLRSRGRPTDRTAFGCLVTAIVARAGQASPLAFAKWVPSRGRTAAISWPSRDELKPPALLVVTDGGSPCPSPCGRRAPSVRPQFAPAERCGRHATTAFLRQSTAPAFPDWCSSWRD
jgi:hypothetical protein